MEIRGSNEYGCGLQDLLQKRKGALSGILNGADYSQWDPKVDELIPQRYDLRSIDLKAENKKALCAKMGLPYAGKTPCIGIISRLADQKGFDLIGETLEEILAMDLRLIILGTGEERYHTMFKKAVKKYPTKMAVSLTFDNTLAHWIEAGSDMFLMPSRYEPCGLNQMYSLAYGTIPIVRATGGLDDTIQPFDPETNVGNGFKFSEASGDALLLTVRQAVSLYHQRERWRRLMENAMNCDFSWSRSAKEYEALYHEIVARHGAKSA